MLKEETMQDSDMFVVVDSVNNLDAVLKREKRYLKTQWLKCRPDGTIAAKLKYRPDGISLKNLQYRQDGTVAAKL